jgi:hypothetical protein
VKPSLKLQYIASEARKTENRFPQLENKLYAFEENDLIEPSRLVVQFVSKCVKCIEKGKGSTSRNQ